SFILMMPYYFFCDLKDLLHEIAGNSIISRYSFLLPLATLIVLFFMKLVQQSRSRFNKLFLFINSLFILFIFSDVVSALVKPEPKNKLTSAGNEISMNYSPCNDCVKPDIYYLIFDAYTSSPILKT